MDWGRIGATHTNFHHSKLRSKIFKLDYRPTIHHVCDNLMFRTSTVVEQAAAHLREEIRKGRWTGLMPGRRILARELGVSHNTVQGALDQLEAERLLSSEGIGKRRRITLVGEIRPARLRINILLYDKRELAEFEHRNIRRMLEDAGHVVEYGEKDLQELKMDAARVARFVQQHPADAWVVIAASREVLEWFSTQPVPAFALFGRRQGLPIAGTSPRKIPELVVAVRRLVALGHRRIVMVVREDRRKPSPGHFEQAFLDELEHHGIRTGSYNLPDWGNSPENLPRGLESLFAHTPPTALIMSEAKLFIAVHFHLAQRGITAPRDVSLMCDDADPAFSWCVPTVAHISWDSRQAVRRIVRWAKNVEHGKSDRRQTYIKCKFIQGGTVGPAPQGR